MPNNTNKWEEFENALKYHDWFYEYSDSHTTWTHGVARRHYLRRLYDDLKLVDAERAFILWNVHAPVEFKLKAIHHAA